MPKILTTDMNGKEILENQTDNQSNGDQNEFNFCGTIVNLFNGNNVTYTTLGVTTLSGRKAYTDYPRIRIFDQELRKKIESIGVHNKVMLSGYISTNKPREDQRNDVPPQTFVCTDIKPAVSLIEADFAVAGKSSAMIPDQNKILVAGQVQRSYIGKGGNINLIIVSFREKKYMKRIHVTYFPRRKENPMELMVPGTRVMVTGRCRTSRKEMPDGSVRYYEGVVADAIAKA